MTVIQYSSENKDKLVDGNGLNQLVIKCSKAGCNSVIMSAGIAKFCSSEDALKSFISSSRQVNTWKFIFPENGESKYTANADGNCNDEGFWILKSPFDFDNIGFSRPIDKPACEGIRYICCADCDHGPLGLQDLQSTDPMILLAVDRVHYKY